MPLSLIALIGIISKLGLVRDMASDVAESCATLMEMDASINEKVPEKQNPAKQVAGGCSVKWR
jgi:hypothetical protein